MLRAVLLGLLTLSTVSCKSHDESQAKSQPGIAAGKVIEVTGTVTLHHGTDGARALAKGEMVDADDEVETGADGSVVIEVQHNNVNWELGANKKGKMRESLAWTQPKKDKSAKAVDQDSAAAGRHAERNAAESSANAAPAAEMERADQADQQEEKKEEAAPAVAAPAPARAKGGSVAKPKPAPAPPVAQPMAPSATVGAAPGGGSKETAPPPPPPPPKAIAKTATKSAPPTTTARALAPSATADMGPLDEGGGGGGAATTEAAPLPGSPDPARLVFDKRLQMGKCLKSVKTLRIKIEVDAAGKATTTFVDKASATDQDCVKKIIDAIKFPGIKTTITTSLKA
ncbi:MAG TPA: hypothetical protein VL326_06840 [Kofleriaceae bacterium]|nr:hypothetical protein [Kofleriaceae bacterium]